MGENLKFKVNIFLDSSFLFLYTFDFLIRQGERPRFALVQTTEFSFESYYKSVFVNVRLLRWQKSISVKHLCSYAIRPTPN